MAGHERSSGSRVVHAQMGLCTNKPGPFLHPCLEEASWASSVTAPGLALAPSPASLSEHSSARGSFMARRASSAMACAVYEPLPGLEIDCLS